MSISDFTIVLNSTTEGEGALNNDKLYNIDWNMFEDCEYDVETTLITDTSSWGTSPDYITRILLFYGLFNTSTNQFRPSTNGYTATINSNKTLLACAPMVGYLYQRGSATTSNPTLRMRRPTGNTLQVQGLDQTGALYVGDVSSTITTACPHYVMTLRFSKVRK